MNLGKMRDCKSSRALCTSRCQRKITAGEEDAHLETRLIFLLSLPRSGSTLLQRYLAIHPDICSVSEPWILLPHLFHLREKGLLAQYSHWTAHKAVSEFIERLPGGNEGYFRALRQFFLRLYGDVANGKRFFLEKTPRYYLIIPEIKRVFPDAKFIFLFRNPLAIFASIINTWSNGNFRSLFRFNSDLYLGPRLLAEGYESLKCSNSLPVYYEEFVNNPSATLKTICRFLEIDTVKHHSELDTNTVADGIMGDTKGRKLYSNIATDSVGRWQQFFNTDYRQKIASDYLLCLGDELLRTMGYSLDVLTDQLHGVRIESSSSLKDRADRLYSYFMMALHSHSIRRDLVKLLRMQPLFPFR